MIAIALSLTLQARCFPLSPPHKIAAIHNCQRAIDQMVDILDLAVAPPPDPGFIIFSKYFQLITKNPFALYTLDALHNALQQQPVAPNALTLWPWARAAWKGDGPALQVLATLFQDLAGPHQEAAHLLYWQRKVPGGAPAIAPLVGLVSADVEQGHLDLLPLFVAPNLPRTRPYHFLVPAQLAHSLRQRGFSTREAFVAPALLNTTYELGMGALGEWGWKGIARLAASHPWGHTKSLRALWATPGLNNDVYMGLLGSCWGAQGLPPRGPQGVPTWPEFQQWVGGAHKDLESFCPTQEMANTPVEGR